MNISTSFLAHPNKEVNCSGTLKQVQRSITYVVQFCFSLFRKFDLLWVLYPQHLLPNWSSQDWSSLEQWKWRIPSNIWWAMYLAGAFRIKELSTASNQELMNAIEAICRIANGREPSWMERHAWNPVPNYTRPWSRREWRVTTGCLDGGAGPTVAPRRR